MTRLVLAPRAADYIRRLADFLLATEPEAASETGAVLISGLIILKHHPLVGALLKAVTLNW